MPAVIEKTNKVEDVYFAFQQLNEKEQMAFWEKNQKTTSS